jgi:thioredoxin-related protein
MNKFRIILIAGVAAALTLSAFTFGSNEQQTQLAVGAEVKQQTTAAHVEWISIEEAQKRCETEPRRIFIDFTTSWCGWCKTMDKNTFSNPVIAAYMNKNYYCVSFNAEGTDTVTFNGQQFVNRNPGAPRSPHDFAVAVLRGQMSYPSYGIFNKPRNAVSILQGYFPPEQFEPYLHYYALEKESTISYADFLKTFKSELPTAPTTPTPTGGGH